MTFVIDLCLFYEVNSGTIAIRGEDLKQFTSVQSYTSKRQQQHTQINQNTSYSPKLVACVHIQCVYTMYKSYQSVNKSTPPKIDNKTSNV